LAGFDAFKEKSKFLDRSFRALGGGEESGLAFAAGRLDGEGTVGDAALEPDIHDLPENSARGLMESRFNP
jgi:hypothetical protein